LMVRVCHTNLVPTCCCRYAFCYRCGAKWKSCKCPSWDEQNIIDAPRPAHPPAPNSPAPVVNLAPVRRAEAIQPPAPPPHVHAYGRVYEHEGNDTVRSLSRRAAMDRILRWMRGKAVCTLSQQQKEVSVIVLIMGNRGGIQITFRSYTKNRVEWDLRMYSTRTNVCIQ
jgi:hypothetical protein